MNNIIKRRSYTISYYDNYYYCYLHIMYSNTIRHSLIIMVNGSDIFTIYICMCVANVSRYHHEETRLLDEPTNRFTSYSVVTTHV